MTGKTSTAPNALLIHDQTVRANEEIPLTVTVTKACKLSGYGPTTIWQFIRDGRLDIVRVAGVRRTLIVYDSLTRLLAPAPTHHSTRRRRGRPLKCRASEGTAP
jgi:hypothetical protein